MCSKTTVWDVIVDEPDGLQKQESPHVPQTSLQGRPKQRTSGFWETLESHTVPDVPV